MIQMPPYNLLQAKAAIASGGLAGNMSGDPIHVPIKWSDFIYTAVSEHMGFIGTTALLILIFYFLSRNLYIAAQISPHRPAAAYMVVGLTASLAFHYIENLGMCVGLLPITGIPLPFVSLGGHLHGRQFHRSRCHAQHLDRAQSDPPVGGQ